MTFNFSLATISGTAPGTSGTTFTVSLVGGSQFVAGKATVIKASVTGFPDPSTAEVVTLPAPSGSTFTGVTRASEGPGAAINVAVGDFLLQGITADDWDAVRALAGTIAGVAVSGTAAAGQAPVASSSSAAAWTNIATQAELDALAAALPSTYGRLWTFAAKTGAYTAAGWEFVLADAASAGFTVTLPSAPAAGTLVAVKKTDSSANVVTVAPQGGALLDGDANGTIVSEDAGAVFGWDGAGWRTVAVQQALNAPSVTSVAGKTGTVTLVAADITDLAGLLAAKVGTTRAITAGTGLTGGGDLSADRTLAVTYGTTAGTAAQGNDSRLSDSRTPSGAAGGDLSGTYPNPAVAKLQGTAVSGTAPSSGQYLRFDGTSWVPATPPGASVLGFFGDGSDGNVTVSTSITLTRDMYYDTLTVASGGTINPGGYRIFCRTACDVQSGGAISSNGNGGGTGATSAAAAFTAARSFRAPTGISGQAAGTGAGSMPTGVPAVLGGFGGGGGNGGSGSAVTTQGGTTTAAAFVYGERVAPHCFTGTLQYAQSATPERAVVCGGTGGGCGSGDGTNSGGGGGGGGGVVLVNARTLNVSGTITATGGAGKAPTAGNCGGGGGGGGGVIYLNSITRTGSGTVSAAGGAGGAGIGTGTAGSAGAAGFILDTAWA